MGGVVNIITKRPDKPQVNLEIEGLKADSFKDGYNWMLRYDAGQQGRFGWSIDYGEKKEDPFILANGDSNNYFGKRKPFNFQGVWQVNEQDKLVFDYGRMEESIERFSGTTHYINEYKRTNYSLGYEGKTNTTDYQMRVYRSIYDKDYESRNKNTGKLNSFDVLERTYTVVEGSASKAWTDNHLFTYGGEYRKEEIDGTRIDSGKNNYILTREGKTSKGSEAEINYYAGYLQDEWTIGDRWLLISALRFDDSDRFGSAISPKLGMTYKIRPNSRLKANVGFGFKTPTSSELYSDFLMGTSTYNIGNSNLDPEKSKNYELSWEGEQGSLAGKLSYFRNDIRNLIDLVATGEYYWNGSKNIPYKKYQNLDKAQLQGVEAEISKTLSEYVTAKLSYVYLDAQDKEANTRLLDRSRHQISTSLLYADKNNGVNASLRGTWHGAYLYDAGTSAKPDMRNESYWLWNANVNKELDSVTTLYFGIDNIFNHRNDFLWINGTIYRTGVKFKF
jgi:outer membrane receptor for ferrienterochelin and colicins